MSPDEPVFREPWEAQAFAMAVMLHQQGLFTWTEWADTLCACIASAPELSYYQHKKTTQKKHKTEKGATSPEELTRYQRAWQHAAHRTPHGQSIDLQSEDLEG